MTRGLRLNSGKTTILNAKRAAQYLWRDENRYLTVFVNRFKRLSASSSPIRPEARRLRRRYSKFLRREKFGYWEEIYKIYYHIIGVLHVTCSDRYTIKVYKIN